LYNCYCTTGWLLSKASCFYVIGPLNAELNPSRHLRILLRAHHILHVSRIRVKHKNLITSVWVNYIIIITYSRKKQGRMSKRSRNKLVIFHIKIDPSNLFKISNNNSRRRVIKKRNETPNATPNATPNLIPSISHVLISFY